MEMGESSRMAHFPSVPSPLNLRQTECFIKNEPASAETSEDEEAVGCNGTGYTSPAIEIEETLPIKAEFVDLLDFVSSTHPDGRYTCDHCEQNFVNFNDFHTHRALHNTAIIKSNRIKKSQHINDNISRYAFIKSSEKRKREELTAVLKRDISQQGISWFRTTFLEGTKKTLYICASHCDKTFPRRRHLDRHVTSYFGERPYFCIFCNKTFIALEYLNKHNSDHLMGRDERPYNCPKCPKNFATKCGFKNHFQLHVNPEKNFKCEICSKTFHKNCQLQIHKRTHTNAKQFKCDICPRQFNYKSNLKSHMREHNLEPMKCQYCDKTFHNKYYFAKHEKGHTTERPKFPCDQCDKVYSKMAALKCHQKVSHVENRPTYECDRCPKIFTDKYSYVYHREAHSPDRTYNCAKCDRKFIRKFQLNHHLRFNQACKDK